MMDSQLDLFTDLTITNKPAGERARRRRVSEIQTQLRRLHDELNHVLYTSKVGDLPLIHSPADIYELLFPFMTPLDHEEFWVVLLNRRNAVIRLIKLYQGTLDQACIRVGEVYKPAIVENAASIVIAHNHPSGEPLPSPQDTALTRAIVQAGKLLDIECLDHLVIGTGPLKDGIAAAYVSMKERGLGFS